MLDAAAIPLRKRRGFVEISLARWAPFPDADFHVEWAGDRAMVWSWSKSAIRDAGGGLEQLANPRRVLPESLFRGAPLPNDEVLVAMDRGVEARVWRNYVLVSSEWWEDAPGLQEWNRFRRGTGLAPASEPGLVEQPVLAETPWIGKRARAVGDIALEYRKHLMAFAVGIAVAALAVPLAASVKLWAATHAVDREITNQDAGLKRILDARDAAGRDIDALNRLLALRPPAGQTRLMATVAGLVPEGAGEVLEWRMPDASTLEVSLRMANPNPATLARSWEASELFDTVNVELGPSPEEVRLKARIVRPSQAGGK